MHVVVKLTKNRFICVTSEKKWRLANIIGSEDISCQCLYL